MITYREYYAGIAMGSLLSARGLESLPKETAEQAVAYAEALCKALDVRPDDSITVEVVNYEGRHG